MAKKLYEEADIQDIAVAIREKNGGTDTYTVAQMGDAVRAISSGGGQTDITVFSFEGEITQTVVGSGVYATLVKDDFLAEHRNKPSLWVYIKFEIESTPYTIVDALGFNSLGNAVSLTHYQFVKRLDGSGAYSAGTILVPINTNSPTSVGCIQITESGELRVYSNSSSNYAIRPCKFKVTVGY